MCCSFDKFEADMLYTRAMHIREQSLGPDHLLLATTLFHLGKCPHSKLTMLNIVFSILLKLNNDNKNNTNTTNNNLLDT